MSPRVAHAMCDSPGFDLSPASGTALPPDPDLLLVALAGQSLEAAELEVRVDGALVAFAATPIATGWILHVPTAGGRELAVRSGYGHDYSYPIDPAWTRQPTRVLDGQRAEDHWSCSFTDIIRVAATGNAIGVRVSWTGAEPGEAIVAAGDGRDGGMFVDGADGPELLSRPRHSWFDLGHHSCRSWNVPQELYQAGGTVTLSALHADGAVEPLGDVALRADRGSILGWTWGGSITDLGDVETTREPAAAPPSFTATVLATLAVTFGALVCSLLGLLAARRRPRTALLAGAALAATGVALAATTASLETALLLAAGAGAIAAALVWRLARHPH